MLTNTKRNRLRCRQVSNHAPVYKTSFPKKKQRNGNFKLQSNEISVHSYCSNSHPEKSSLLQRLYRVYESATGRLSETRRWAKTSRENFPKLIMRCWRIFLAVRMHQAKTWRAQRQITSEPAKGRGKNGEVIKKIGGGVKIRRKAGAISTGGASGQSPQEMHP